jgi:uncharacterized membrane protein YeiH
MSVDTIVFIIEIIGTVAFASSGAMVGIRRNMDIFGVIVMAITTAVGGGIIRDLILGVKVPSTFRNPVYVEFATATALILFIIFYIRKQALESSWMVYYERLMLFMDAIGLGAFTVIGVQTACQMGYGNKIFLQLFVGVVTGVGGGVIRDMMAMQMPFIFVRHVYACASLIGALVCVLLMQYHKAAAMILGAAVVIVIRILAAKYRWNLPKINIEQ